MSALLCDLLSLCGCYRCDLRGGTAAREQNLSLPRIWVAELDNKTIYALEMVAVVMLELNGLLMEEANSSESHSCLSSEWGGVSVKLSAVHSPKKVNCRESCVYQSPSVHETLQNPVSVCVCVCQGSIRLSHIIEFTPSLALYPPLVQNRTDSPSTPDSTRLSSLALNTYF